MNTDFPPLIIETPIGSLSLSSDLERVQKLQWMHSEQQALKQTNSCSALQKSVLKQVERYFQQAHADWLLPLRDCGTVFQQKVWRYLQTIPIGETRTYTDVANALGSSPRAVANACRANPFVIIVPCHRVIAKSGLGGYDGQTVGRNIVIKQWLLDHERNR